MTTKTNQTYRYTTEQLDALRDRTDPLAEHIVDELKEHYQLDQINFLFRQIPQHLAKNDFPLFLATYISDIGDLPSWIDLDKIHKGQEVFWDYGREVILALLCRSLPMSYICGNGAKVLTTTTRLIDIPKNPKFTRRLLETLQFVVNICSDDSSMDKLGKGLICIKKVRLIHATIRRFIKQAGDWPSEELGEPINQEDLLITMCSFNIEVVKGLARMGIHLEAEQREAWSHLWFVVGYLLGIEEKMLPQSFAACEELSQRILVSQAAKTEEGQLLVASCVTFLAEITPIPFIGHSFSYATFKAINDPQYHEMMGLSEKHRYWDWLLPKLLRTTLGIDQKLEKRSPIFHTIIHFINKWLITGLLKIVMRDEKYFYLPESLKD